MESKNFRAIVVGGGPVGLTAAHILQKAGIDFVVLERRSDVVLDVGATLTLMPMGMRILKQLGLLEQMKNAGTPLGRTDRLDHSGRELGHMEWFSHMERHTGFCPHLITRYQLTSILYNTLPKDARAKILKNKKLSNIETDSNGVLVTCDDGSSYSGSIVIGADGVHSTVRSLMRKLALQAGSSDVNDEKPFLTTYRAAAIRTRCNFGVPSGTMCESHGREVTSQLFTGPDHLGMGVYERLPCPSRERIQYNETDMQAFARKWSHLVVASKPGGGELTLGEVAASACEARLVSLEEGVVKHWSWGGRIVLVGDAAHKMTPSTGAGYNNGIADVVALVNELHPLLSTTSTTTDEKPAQPRMPPRAQLTLAFKSYQQSRSSDVTAETQRSGLFTDVATWKTKTHGFMDRKILPSRRLQKLLIDIGGSKGIIGRTECLFVH